MKKSCVLIFLFLSLFLLSGVISDQITGDTITGQASNQATSVSISVTNNSALRIISPENTTYDYEEYILLDYADYLIESVWYKFNGTNNVSVNSSFYFQADPGVHTLYLYGNMSNGTELVDSVVFSVNAAPVPPIPSSGGGGGVKDKEEISFNKEQIGIVLKQGETKNESFYIRNNYGRAIDVKIEDFRLEEFLIDMSVREFSLKEGESREINLTFRANKDVIPTLYVGNLLVSTKSLEESILVFIEVESEELLFDIKAKLLEKPEVYEPLDKVRAEIQFYNLGEEEKAELNLEYLIKDEKGNIIVYDYQTIVVGTSLTLIKLFELPKSISDGKYVFYVKAEYNNKVASSSEWFNVKRKTLWDGFNECIQNLLGGIMENVKIIYFFLVIGLLFCILFLLRKRRKKKIIRKKYSSYKKRRK